MATVFRFHDFQLDTSTHELRRGSSVIAVEPLVLDLLVCLLENPGVLLSRDELMQKVWKGRIVSESTISTAIKSARKALGDTGQDQKLIRTIRGRGIQFHAQVETVAAGAKGQATETAPAFSDIATQPALYVRPFDTPAHDELDSLARTLRVRTTSILARVPLLRVASSFPGADESGDPRELRAQFGMTLVLQARLQRSGPTLALDATLIETREGFQIWAQRFEVESGAAEQESLLRAMIERVEPQLMQAMLSELKTSGGEESPRAKLLQAIGLLALKGWHRTTFLEATARIEAAIAQEPDLALSHAYLALLKALGHRVGLLRDDPTIVPSAIAAAERALELESQDSTILGLAGCALADVGQVDRAIPILNKSIERNPQNGHAKTALGAALMMKREFDAAVRYLAEGIELSPADSRRSVWGAALALGQLARGEHELAREAAERACQEDDRVYLPRLALAAVHVAREDEAAARAAVAECLRTKPDLSREEVNCLVGSRLGAPVWAIAGKLTPRPPAK